MNSRKKPSAVPASVVETIAAQMRKHAEADPLDRFPPIDVATLNLIGEIALAASDEGTFTTKQLATLFHAHLERLFRNRVCDEAADRENMIGCLQTSLMLCGLGGETSKSGYYSIGTVLVKPALVGQEKAFSFIRPS